MRFTSNIIRLPNYLLSLDYFISTKNCDITFLTVFILTHPVNFPRGRKPEHPEKTHDFRQSVDWLFSHESVARIEPTNSEVKGTCSHDCATETPKLNVTCVNNGHEYLIKVSFGVSWVPMSQPEQYILPSCLWVCMRCHIFQDWWTTRHRSLCNPCRNPCLSQCPLGHTPCIR